MKIREKILSGVLSLSMLAVCIPGVQRAYAENYNLSSLENVAVSTAVTNPTPTLTQMEGYARITFPQGTYAAKYTLTDLPNVKLVTNYEMPANGKTVISVKMRTSDVTGQNFRKQILLNASSEGFSTGSNLNQLINFRGTDMQYNKSGSKLYTTAVADKWYTIKTILYSDSNGYPTHMSYKLLDESGVTVASVPKAAIYDTAFGQSRSISQLNFATRVDEATTTSDVTWDIADVKIYQENWADSLESRTVTGNPAPVVSAETESGESFARITFPVGTYATDEYANTYQLGCVPDVRYTLETPYVMEANSDTVIIQKVRTNDITTDFRKQLMLNNNDNYAVKDAKYQLWEYRKNTLYANYGGDTTSTQTTLYSAMEAHQWYTVKITLHTDATGVPTKISYRIKNQQNDIIAEVDNATIDSTTLKTGNTISKLDYTIRVPALNTITTSDITWDFTEPVIYNGKYEDVSLATAKTYFADEPIAIQLVDTPTNINSVLTGITVRNDSAPVAVTAVYDSTSKQIKITHESGKFPAGEYSIVLPKLTYADGEATIETLTYKVLEVNMTFENNTDTEKLVSQTASAAPSTPTVAKAAEDSNNFARITLPSGDYTAGAHRFGEVPDVRLSLLEPYTFKANADTVISVKMRTNDVSGFRKALVLNAESKYPMGYNQGMYWALNTNVLNSVYASAGEGNKNNDDWQGKYLPMTESYSANEWYTINTMVRTDASGVAKQIRYYLTDEAGQKVYDSGIKTIEQLKLQTDTISQLDFAVRIPNATETGVTTVNLANDITWDIDDIKIYTEPKSSFEIVKTSTGVSAKASLNNTYGVLSGSVYIAIYREGRLIAVEVANVNSAADGVSEVFATDEIPKEKYTSGDIVKAFLWESNMWPVYTDTWTVE